MSARLRLDQLLVDRGLAESREKARALILAGAVLVNRQKADKPGHAVLADSSIEVTERPRYVSRGGLKLEAALAHFAVTVTGKVCLDAGASTGGFTDCLLQHGAAHVYSFDVGHGQLDWKLRNDPRVVVREAFNLRYLQPADLADIPLLATCDVSFISATLILPALAGVLAPEGEMIILVKPQFEVGKGEVGKGGIVRDSALHQAACGKVRAAAEALGFRASLIDSPILGAEGNREFLLHATR